MKKIYLLSAILFLAINTFAQIEGTWRLAPAAGSLAVGPAQGDYSWWSNSTGDVSLRACLFDDSIKFDANGTMTHYMDGSTWIEGWQGLPNVCNTPVAPHDGTTNAPYTYTFNSTNGELTVNGIGAHMGLAKVINGGELTSPANAASSITYISTFSNNNNTLTLEISIGGGWWKFVYQRTATVTMPDPNVTFKVNMSNYTGTIANGVFVNGSFNGWCGSCNPMSDMGNGMWQVTLPIPASNIEYKFTVDGWNDQENFTANDACVDPNMGDPYYNRYLQITGDVVLSAVCFNSCDPCPSNATQLIGTWKLKPNAGSLAVGPALGDGSWWSNSAADVTTRACLFDDSIKFEANGTMTHYMDGNTWLEAWQGADPAACGTPVAPHNGVGPFTYSYSGGELTINGVGGHIGLAKVYNGGELTIPANAPASITYQITFANNDNTMIADINFGPGWWRFIYEKTQQVVVADPNITFKVDMADYTGTIATGVFLNGSFNNWCGNCTPMTNSSGSIWEVTVPLTAGPIQYKFTIDGWNDFENFVGGESCVDTIADGFVNRYYVVSSDATLPAVCFGSCEACPSIGIVENVIDLDVFPNPANNKLTVSSTENINTIEIISMNGLVVLQKSINQSLAILNVENLKSGTYFVKVITDDNYLFERIIIE
ncbi:MAG: T9SS type A sorting domain-containing protein [Crocinitomicaceae bacterium]